MIGPWNTGGAQEWNACPMHGWHGRTACPKCPPLLLDQEHELGVAWPNSANSAAGADVQLGAQAIAAELLQRASEAASS